MVIDPRSNTGHQPEDFLDELDQCCCPLLLLSIGWLVHDMTFISCLWNCTIPFSSINQIHTHTLSLEFPVFPAYSWLTSNCSVLCAREWFVSNNTSRRKIEGRGEQFSATVENAIFRLSCSYALVLVVTQGLLGYWFPAQLTRGRRGGRKAQRLLIMWARKMTCSTKDSHV